MGKTIDKKFNPKEAVEVINSTMERLRNYKIRHPQLKRGFSLCYGGILNAYREGDLTFKQAVGYLKKTDNKIIIPFNSEK